MRLVLGTNAAVEGAVQFSCGSGVSKAVAFASELFSSLILGIIRPVNILKFPVFCALFFYVNFVVFFEDGGVKSLEAFWAYGFCFFDDSHFDTTERCNIFRLVIQRIRRFPNVS